MSTDPVFIEIGSLVSSEQHYLKELATLIRVIKPLCVQISNNKEGDMIFNGIMSLLSFHKHLLENYLLPTKSVNCCLPFDAFSEKFEIMKNCYVAYAQNYEKQMKLVKKMKMKVKEKFIKSLKLSLNNSESYWNYFSHPMKRMNKYSDLLKNIYNHFPEDKKNYSSLLKNIDELNQNLKSQMNKFQTENVLFKITNQDILNNGKILKVGKYLNTFKSRKYVYLLQTDNLYCLIKKNSNLEVEEEYPISSIFKTQITENQLYIHMYPEKVMTIYFVIDFVIEDKEEAEDWANLITKLKQDWINQHDKQILYKQFLSGHFEEEKYWQIHSTENPEHWIALGDMYKWNKHIKKAIGCYESARAKVPRSYPLLYQLAKMYLSLGDQRKGLAYLNRISLAMECTDHVDFYIRAKTEELLKKYKQEINENQQ